MLCACYFKYKLVLLTYSYISTLQFGNNNVNITRVGVITEEDDPLQYNIEHGHGNFQGDMMLTQAQLHMMEGDGPKRAFLLAASRWPRSGLLVNIPYTLDPSNGWSSRELLNIQKAMQEYKRHTCIRY